MAASVKSASSARSPASHAPQPSPPSLVPARSARTRVVLLAVVLDGDPCPRIGEVESVRRDAVHVDPRTAAQAPAARGRRSRAVPTTRPETRPAVDERSQVARLDHAATSEVSHESRRRSLTVKPWTAHQASAAASASRRGSRHSRSAAVRRGEVTRTPADLDDVVRSQVTTAADHLGVRWARDPRSTHDSIGVRRRARRTGSSRPPAPRPPYGRTARPSRRARGMRPAHARVSVSSTSDRRYAPWTTRTTSRDSISAARAGPASTWPEVKRERTRGKAMRRPWPGSVHRARASHHRVRRLWRTASPRRTCGPYRAGSTRPSQANSTQPFRPTQRAWR